MTTDMKRIRVELTREECLTLLDLIEPAVEAGHEVPERIERAVDGALLADELERGRGEEGSAHLTLVVLAAVLPSLASVAYFTAQMFGALEVIA